MPWMIPSHQALVLPLKSRKPRTFCGLGLVFGSAAPDLAYILRLEDNAIAAHTFVGQLYVTVSLVLVLHWTATALVFPWLAPYVPTGAPMHLDRVMRSRPAHSLGEWARLAFSALIGGLTHVGLDGFTHGNHVGWARHYFPALSHSLPLSNGSVPVYEVLQVALTILLGIVSLVLWQRMAVRDAEGLDRTHRFAQRSSARGRLLGLLIALAAAGAVIAIGLHPESPLERRAELAFYGAIAFPIYALVLAPLFERVRRLLTAPANDPRMAREEL